MGVHQIAEIQKLQERIVSLEKELHVYKTVSAAAVMAVGTRLDTDQEFADKTDRMSLLGESLEFIQEFITTDGRNDPVLSEQARVILGKAREKGLIK